ncbi:hypothetical protein D6201_03320 [Aurantiacibacter aquimixticola]|uniref:Uncharacterized protein n=2 Tax=Aurantiacibacter aquimixticola TaxID=1958945 RepID=A0A419RRV3_9SPHN|nr:hypothetical protein D6201_03320 [Aurantiacibacter aquimixticola]
MAAATALASGLASIAAPAPIAAAQQTRILPADPQDFQCYVLLQQRRSAFLANATLPTEQRAEFVNNLTIISAFYAGRISHYSSAEAVSQFQSARTELDAASAEQRDAFANVCTSFYVSVANLLSATSEQVPSPRQ